MVALKERGREGGKNLVRVRHGLDMSAVAAAAYQNSVIALQLLSRKGEATREEDGAKQPKQVGT
jgi:hypothetical protein